MKASGALSVGCDVHPWMRGFIYIAENPYYAITDTSGSFSITDIPPGDYTLKLWRDNWQLNQMKDGEGRIQSYKWGEEIVKTQQIHIAPATDTTVQFSLP